MNKAILVISTCLFLFLCDLTQAVSDFSHYTIDNWIEYKENLSSRMQMIMGTFPKIDRSAPKIIIEEEKEFSNYTRLKLTYKSEENSWVPAYLLMPKPLDNKKGHFGILCLHQTHQKGCCIVAGLEDRPDDEYAVELVLQGYVCLCPCYPLFWTHQPNLKTLCYKSGTMKAIVDNIRGLDLLESFHFVKPNAFAVIGHSLGGHNGIFTAFFDDRIKVIISSCGFDSFQDYQKGNISGWTSEKYMPLLKNTISSHSPFDFDEIIASLAPRAFFCSAPIYDQNFLWWSVEKLSIPIKQIYTLHMCPENAVFIYPSVYHSFNQSIRLQAYAFLMSHLSK